MYAFCLSCPSTTFGHQYGGFVSREWLAAKGLLSHFVLHYFHIYQQDGKIRIKSTKNDSVHNY